MEFIELGKDSEKLMLGATRGQRFIASFLANHRRCFIHPVRVVISFREIEHANSSFIKACFLHLFLCGRLYAEGRDISNLNSDSIVPINCYPAVSHCSPEVLAEIDEVFVSRQLPYVFLRSFDAHEWKRGQIRGYLDSALLETLEEILTCGGSATAAMLRSAHPGEVAGTAWNNRLEALHALRLVERSRQGREALYNVVVSTAEIWVSGSFGRKRQRVS